MRRRWTVRHAVAAAIGLATASFALACGLTAVGGLVPDNAGPGDETEAETERRDSYVPSNDASSEQVVEADVVTEEAAAPRPVGIVCGAANCAATDTCFECAAARTCINGAAGCTGGGWFQCDDPAECAATGAVCCVDTISGASVNARCETDAAQCVAGGVLCDPGMPAACPGGKQCLAAAGRLAGRFRCQ